MSTARSPPPPPRAHVVEPRGDGSYDLGHTILTAQQVAAMRRQVSDLGKADRWLAAHRSALVRRYGRQVIAVGPGGLIGVARTRREVLSALRRRGTDLEGCRILRLTLRPTRWIL